MKQTKILLLIAIMMIAGSLYAQTSNQKLTNKEIVENFLHGFNDPLKFPASLALLKDDYTFSNPMIKLNSKVEFIALAKEIGAVLTGVKLIKTTQNGDWVGTYYEFTSNIPGLESNMASEWFRLEEGMIIESHLIYDASEWRKVYENME